MRTLFSPGVLAAAVLAGLLAPWSNTPACCPAPPGGTYAVNADQTVVLLWDAARKTQHFVRQASFQSNAADFGFIIPSPSVPELAEAGNAAFGYLRELTRPAVEYRRRRASGGCACSESKHAGSGSAAAGGVQVLHTQRVAGFDAVVLAADKTDDLTAWLKEHGYAYSPAVAAWAEPYVTKGWKFTALKIAKDAAGEAAPDVDAAALRMSFVTDEPLFPYREPDYGRTPPTVDRRLLRIFLVAESRYDGALVQPWSWSGKEVWSDRLSDEQRQSLLSKLQLPADTGPAEFRLTEFEDFWSTEVKPSDLRFFPAQNQATFRRPPMILYTTAAAGSPDAMFYVAAALVAWPTLRRRRHGN